MLDPQASRFWQAALLSGLMDAEALNACWNAIPPGKREAPSTSIGGSPDRPFSQMP